MLSFDGFNSLQNSKIALILTDIAIKFRKNLNRFRTHQRPTRNVIKMKSFGRLTIFIDMLQNWVNPKF